MSIDREVAILHLLSFDIEGDLDQGIRFVSDLMEKFFGPKETDDILIRPAAMTAELQRYARVKHGTGVILKMFPLFKRISAQFTHRNRLSPQQLASMIKREINGEMEFMIKNPPHLPSRGRPLPYRVETR